MAQNPTTPDFPSPTSTPGRIARHGGPTRFPDPQISVPQNSDTQVMPTPFSHSMPPPSEFGTGQTASPLNGLAGLLAGAGADMSQTGLPTPTQMNPGAAPLAPGMGSFGQTGGVYGGGGGLAGLLAGAAPIANFRAPDTNPQLGSDDPALQQLLLQRQLNQPQGQPTFTPPPGTMY